MDRVLWWIVGAGISMSALALVGGLMVLLSKRTLERILLPLVALSAGSLLGGAFFHMLPAATSAIGNTTSLWTSVVLGFIVFFVLEQFLHWHHCHRLQHDHPQPLGYLILIADGLHNLIGGLAIGGAFVIDVRVGVGAWLAAAAHEVPQELGDFGALLHAGWSKRSALLFNFLSALTFLVGALIAYALSTRIDVALLVPFAAGNFIYIAAADLIPEINRSPSLRENLIHFACFVAGLALLLAARLAFD